MNLRGWVRRPVARRCQKTSPGHAKRGIGPAKARGPGRSRCSTNAVVTALDETAWRFVGPCRPPRRARVDRGSRAGWSRSAETQESNREGSARARLSSCTHGQVPSTFKADGRRPAARRCASTRDRKKHLSSIPPRPTRASSRGVVSRRYSSAGRGGDSCVPIAPTHPPHPRRTQVCVIFLLRSGTMHRFAGR